MSRTSKLSAHEDTNTGTQFTDAYSSKHANQGIFDGRPEGEQPPRAPVTLDTIVDKDASAEPQVGLAAATITGATSQEVSESAGKPGSGMSSKELHHNGMHKRKNPGRGVEDTGFGEAGRGREAAQDEGLVGLKVQ